MSVRAAAAAAVTRLAPSPTGALHLGNARTFLATWAVARRRGWRIVLRIDDLEGPRVKPGADRQAVDDLAWLGLDWDGDIVYQSRRTAEYEDALARLWRGGRVYACTCTRSEVESASRGIAEADGAARYPGTCRGRFTSAEAANRLTGRPAAVRFTAGDGDVAFDDAVIGPLSFRAGADFGDFVVRKSDGEFGYHLATVIDDAAAGVTHVIRGQDLTVSTPRQLLLYDALGLSDLCPAYAHLPLVVGADGRKLAKRHGDTRLAQLRAEGVSAGQVRTMLARWSGFAPSGEEITAAEWVERFDLRRLPRAPVTYDDATDRPRAAARLGGGRP